MLEDGTYDKDGQKIAYPDGYQVGIWNKPWDVEIPDNDPYALKSIIDELTRTTETFGAWTDQTTGIFWVEPCVWIPDLDSALAIARALGQVAIWDWANMAEILLKNQDDSDTIYYMT